MPGWRRKRRDRKALQARTQLMQETLASLSLYIGRHTWTQLTTAEKECLADAIDAEFRDGSGIGKTDRWWRE